MNPKVRSSILAAITAIFFFVFSAEWISDEIGNHKALIDAPLILLVASFIALAGGAIVFWWFQRTLSGNLFRLARNRLVASKRFSIVLGVLIGAPAFPWLWYVNFDAGWGPFIQNILVTPGMMILGYIIVASLVHSAFWCLDGLGEAEKNDNEFASGTTGQITKEPKEKSESTAAIVTVVEIEKEIGTSPSAVPIHDIYDTHSIGAPEKKPSRNYLIRHWRGEISLGVTYWVNGFLTVIVQSALVAILAQMQGNYSLRAMAVASIGVALFSVTAWLWLVVGTWRSADRHVERGGSSQWAGAAKGIVVLSILGLALKLPTNIVPYVNELALIASGNDPIGDVEIKVAANGRSVIIRGTLREGSAAKIQTILDAAPGATVLVLDSNGGRIAEAQQLALVVRTRNFDTYVEDLCASACTFVFLAGKNRAATPNARIGFHQPSFPGLDIDAQRSMTKDMMDVYRAAGLPTSFLQRIGDTSPEDMWYPTHDELIASNVINSVPLMGKAAAIGLGVRSKQEMNQVVRGEPSEDPAPVASADINTQMINATQAGNLSAVTEAVKKGADVNARTSFGYSALSGASTNGHTAVVRFLLDKGVNVNERLRDGTNALDQASFGGHFATTELLLARGANPNFKKDSGFTPLISAALRGHLEIVKLLLDNGADVNEKTESGSTALHHAAFQNHADVIDLLLRRGANPEIRNVTGYTYKDSL